MTKNTNTNLVAALLVKTGIAGLLGFAPKVEVAPKGFAAAADTAEVEALKAQVAALEEAAALKAKVAELEAKLAENAPTLAELRYADLVENYKAPETKAAATVSVRRAEEIADMLDVTLDSFKANVPVTAWFQVNREWDTVTKKNKHPMVGLFGGGSYEDSLYGPFFQAAAVGFAFGDEAPRARATFLEHFALNGAKTFKGLPTQVTWTCNDSADAKLYKALRAELIAAEKAGRKDLQVKVKGHWVRFAEPNAQGTWEDPTLAATSGVARIESDEAETYFYLRLKFVIESFEVVDSSQKDAWVRVWTRTAVTSTVATKLVGEAAAIRNELASGEDILASVSLLDAVVNAMDAERKGKTADELKKAKEEAKAKRAPRTRTPKPKAAASADENAPKPAEESAEEGVNPFFSEEF